METPDSQKRTVKSLMSHPLFGYCFMVSMKWWNQWKLYVNYDSDDGPADTAKVGGRPFGIDNTDLVMSSASKTDGTVQHARDKAKIDWEHNVIRPDIAHEKDFVLVSGAVWYSSHAYTEAYMHLDILSLSQAAFLC